MKRAVAGTFVALLVLSMTTLVASSPVSAAPAQQSNACFPGSDPDYPPAGAAVQIDLSLVLLSGTFIPGGTGHIEIGGAEANVFYCGTTFSTPITLPAKTANAQGKLVYDIAVPADFELGAFHHIDVFKQQVKVGNFDFCVNKAGSVAPSSQCAKAPVKNGGPLAKTGTNRLLDIARIALVAVTLGATALYVRRRLTNPRTSA